LHLDKASHRSSARTRQAQSLPLSPHLPRHKRHETARLGPLLTRSSSTSTLPTPSLSALRTRRAGAGTPDPALASEVIKGYLLPMFEAEMQVRTDIARSSGFGTSRLRGLEAVPGTVFGEMKLSDQLSREVVKLRNELKTAHVALKDAEQRVASALSDSKHYQVRSFELQESLKMLHLQYSQDTKSVSAQELAEAKHRSDMRTVMDSYAAMEEECKAKNALLQEQYALIDKLKTKETSQDHMSSLLQMQNDIIGERLKGLYSAIQSAVDNHDMEQKFSLELSQLFLRQRELADFIEQVVFRLDKVTTEKEKAVGKCVQLIAFRTEMKAERDRIARIAKEKILILQGQLQKCEEEKEKLTSELSKTEQNFKDLTDEYEKLRLKAKQYRLKRKMYGEEDEKVCKNCQRVFIESENYNWSCRRHQSEYSGEIYWCCGKAGKDTPGCKISRHETKEEDEEGEDVGKIEKDPSSMHCSVTPTPELQETRPLRPRLPSRPQHPLHLRCQRRGAQSHRRDRKQAEGGPVLSHNRPGSNDPKE